jgi:hypothetical protein
MKPAANERNLFLESDGLESFMIEGDLVKTQRIAQNLLLNAIKYTEEGGVKVGWAEVAPRTYERWMLYVQDTGPGLETALLPRWLKQSKNPRKTCRWSNKRPRKPVRTQPLWPPLPCFRPSRRTDPTIKCQVKASAYRSSRNPASSSTPAWNLKRSAAKGAHSGLSSRAITKASETTTRPKYT